MPVSPFPKAENPLILRAHRLMEAFAKSDDERDFYLDHVEGFIIYVDLDKAEEDLEIIQDEITKNPERYSMIPKMTFYETKKIMEGFVNEKVYDIDVKEKLLDIIGAKEARENFLEFVYDHDTEWEKWQQFYQERSRIRIIEWLRDNEFHFVFEEDLEMTKSLIEKLKEGLFENKVGKDIQAARKQLVAKAKTYYSTEALNPRPKRGRPPKQTQKPEIEMQVSRDIYTTVPKGLRQFLFTPDIHGASALTFSSKFETEEELASRRPGHIDQKDDMQDLNKTLASLRSLSSRWMEQKRQSDDMGEEPPLVFGDDDDEDDDDDDDFDDLSLSGEESKPAKRPLRRVAPVKQKKEPVKKPVPPKPRASAKKRIMPFEPKKKKPT
jgi:hypothetical protein